VKTKYETRFPLRHAYQNGDPYRCGAVCVSLGLDSLLDSERVMYTDMGRRSVQFQAVLLPSFCVDQFCGTPKLAKYGLARFPVCRRGTRFKTKSKPQSLCTRNVKSVGHMYVCIYAYMYVYT